MLSKGRPAAQTVRVHGARLRELLAVRDGDEDDMRAAGSLGRVDGVDTLLILGLGVALPRFEEVRDEEQLLCTERGLVTNVQLATEPAPVHVTQPQTPSVQTKKPSPQ